ncbi:MAG: hypothetical protein R2991_10560 [Thermoanaerobaculia bacterium]
MTEVAVAGELGEADLDDHARVDPGVIGSGRNPVDRGLLRQAEGVQPVAQIGELPVAEPGADPADVGHPRTVKGAEMQTAEPGSAPLGHGVAEHGELAGQVRSDLDPIGGTARAVGAVAALRDEALEPERPDLFVELLPPLLDVVGEAHGAGSGQDLAEQPLALLQRQATEVPALEGQQVEGVEDGGQSRRRGLHVEGTGELGALLQELEAGPRLVVEHHHLAVEDEALEGKRAQGQLEIRIHGRRVAAAAIGESHRAPAGPPPVFVELGGEHPVAVVLELEEPLRTGEGLVAQLGEHRRELARVQVPVRCPQPVEGGVDRLGAVGAGLQLVHGQAGEDGPGRQLLGVLAGGGAVGLLDQQPLLGIPRRLHQRPETAQLVTAQLEEQLALAHALLGLEVMDGGTAVPDDHRAGAVVALGDQPLEVAVLERVVLRLHGEPLLGGIEGRALGYGPGAQDAAHLQTQVVVQAPGRVLLDDEQAGRAAPSPPNGSGAAPAARFCGRPRASTPTSPRRA